MGGVQPCQGSLSSLLLVSGYVVLFILCILFFYFHKIVKQKNAFFLSKMWVHRIQLSTRNRKFQVWVLKKPTPLHLRPKMLSGWPKKKKKEAPSELQIIRNNYQTPPCLLEFDHQLVNIPASCATCTPCRHLSTALPATCDTPGTANMEGRLWLWGSTHWGLAQPMWLSLALLLNFKLIQYQQQ